MGKTLGSMVEKNLQQIQLQKIQEQLREIKKPRRRKTWPKNSKLCMGKKKHKNPWWPSAVALFMDGSGLSAEFSGSVGLRKWWSFRTGWTLERQNQKLFFFYFFNKIRCFHVYCI
jgi:hypothetical protein